MPRPMSAKQLRERNPALAAQWARYITDNRAALVSLVTAVTNRRRS